MIQEYDKRVRDLLEKGVRDGVFPGAQLLVSKGGRVILFEGVGYLSLIPDPEPMAKDAIFDLASLTKPLATTLAMMRLVDEGKIRLDNVLSEVLPISSLSDKKALSLRLILNHSAGFGAWRPFYLDLVKYRHDRRKEILRGWLMEEPLEYLPGKGSLYSDLGFMALEWVIEEASGMSMHQYVEDQVYGSLLLKKTYLCRNSSSEYEKGVFAATENCPWRERVLSGEVHDENAFALGGYSGHAGLFGTAEEVYRIVSRLREHYQRKRDDYLKPETVQEFFRKQNIVEGSSWALGWDTPSQEGSSSGKYFSANSVGHLGFTGTSVWMDLDMDVTVILLTNRVHPTRENDKIKMFRPMIHDLIMEEIQKIP